MSSWFTAGQEQQKEHDHATTGKRDGRTLRPRYFDRQQLTANDSIWGWTTPASDAPAQPLPAWLGRRLRQPSSGRSIGRRSWSFEIGAGCPSPRRRIYIPAATTIDVETMVLGCLGTQEDCPEVHLVGR